MPPPADQRPPTPTEWAVVALNDPCQRWLGTRHCAATPTRLYLGGRYCYAHAPHHQNCDEDLPYDLLHTQPAQQTPGQ